MPVISSPEDFLVDDLFVALGETSGHRFLLKCEGVNLAGSVKLKSAAEMVADIQRSGRLRPGSILVESSSGNLGVALAMIAASRGIPFLCVTDLRCNPAALKLMRACGADVHVVESPDPHGGLLGGRLNYIRSLCASDDRYLWINQYTSPGNWAAHYRHTGPQIAKAFPDVSVVFVGAGTTGTLMGCARYFRALPRAPRIVAVDSVGSVTFGGPPSPRWLPGLGSALRSEQLDLAYVDDVVLVDEIDAVRSCRELAHRGFCFGASTGTVVAGARRWLAEHQREVRGPVIAVAPDQGERYLDTVYDDDWVATTYSVELASRQRSPLTAVQHLDGPTDTTIDELRVKKART